MKKFLSITIIIFITLSSSLASNWPSGYIPKNQIINIDSIIGVPPSTDSLAFSSDKAISEAVFSQNKNTTDYKIAIHDASNDQDVHIADFSKALAKKLLKTKILQYTLY